MNCTKLAQEYLATRPAVKECLRRGLVNHSAVAREICKEHGLDRFDAVLMACRRYASRMRKQSAGEKRVTSLVRAARIESRNKIVVVVVEKPRDYERLLLLQREVKREGGEFTTIELADSLVLISGEDQLDLIRARFSGRVLKVLADLVKISMHFSEKIETTPGVVSFVYGLLAENGINVREEMSCWNELMVIIAAEDAARAMRVLVLSER